MSKAGDFIKKHGMDYRDIVVQERVDAYLTEMGKGLRGEESSLLMLPTYLTMREEIRRESPVVCIDAGGTNLRICLAWFDAKNQFVIKDMKRYRMPGVEASLDADAFFDVMAQIIAPYCDQSREIVLSFAYRAEPMPDIDAKIIEITKEVRVSGAEGRLLAKEITAALARMGLSDVHMIVINDSVASALAGRADMPNGGFGAFTGTILGTGSNSCYTEETANITKLDGGGLGKTMVINTEAGSYAGFPRTDIDIAFDETTVFPGLGVAEKMTSGGYMGALCEFALKRAAEEDVFGTKSVENIVGLRSEDVSEYLADGTGIVTENMLDEEDEQNARELLENIVLRAARLVAVQMAAVAVKSYKTNHAVLMSVEGTTYEKMQGLQEELKGQLEACLRERGIQPTLVTVRQAVMKGCALAALARE